MKLPSWRPPRIASWTIAAAGLFGLDRFLHKGEKKMAPGKNEGVEHGKWGEECAARFLERRGYEIIERNARPLKRDRRLEIDIVAFDEKRDILVFVEVKQHARHSVYERRMRSVDRAKLDRTRRACRAWLAKNGWNAGYRFDVVEIFGEPGSGAPEIDHIERVRLFRGRAEFVDWNS